MNKNAIVKTAMAVGMAAPMMFGLSAAANAQSLTSQGWFKACSDQGQSKICNVQYQVLATTGQLVTSIQIAEITGEISRRIFQVTVPTGRRIQPGIEIQVDDKKGNAIPFLACTPRLCVAETQLNDSFVEVLKKGGKLTAISTNLQGKKSPVEISLNGFTAAFDGPPIKREELQSRQEKLAEELKQKAEETKRKLQEAQEAATE